MDVAAILSDLVDHGFEDVSPERKLAVINETLQDVAAREPWPMLLKTASLTVDDVTGVATVPADLGIIQSIWRDDRRKRLVYVRPDEVNDAVRYPTGGYYTVRGGGISVFGPPGDMAFTIDYFRVPAEVDELDTAADIWLPSRWHRGIIVNGSVYKLYLMEDDVELSREFERLYEKAIENARYALHMQNLEDDFIHVVDEADWDYE